MSKIHVLTLVSLLFIAIAVGCSSSDQAAIDKAVSATLAAAQPATADATATPEATAIPAATATIEKAVTPTLAATQPSTAATATVTPEATATIDKAVSPTLAAAQPATITATPEAGKDGLDGEKGDTGAQGQSGKAGVDGVAGVQGPKGEVGPVGADGVDGEPGIQGEVGSAGASGAQGISDVEVTSTTSQRLTDISSSSRSEPLSLLPTPFQNQTDYWALQPFVVQANQLEMQFHNGFDYFTDRNKVAVQAVSTGRVMFVEIFERAPDGASQINLAWQSPSGEVVLYTLEPSAGPADDTKIAEQKILAQKMMESMTIQAGDDVRQGEFIGYLHGQDEWAHVHMTVKASNNGPEEWLCPADFITKGKESDLLSKSLIWAEHLYKDSKQPELCNY